jgi:hypothetical protein
MGSHARGNSGNRLIMLRVGEVGGVLLPRLPHLQGWT